MDTPIESTDWHYAPLVKRTETDDGDPLHGSYVASKAAGARFGIAKNARSVMLKASLHLADVLWASVKARDDIRAHSRQKKFVVVWAGSPNVPYSPGQNLSSPWMRLKQLMREPMYSDVVNVFPSGNGAERSGQVDTLPAL